ncbi:hypothetical protein BN973_01116 [Mycobacterium triplex]|uniref:Uncharacterized protein n=1 Tax=Mycobacterium triplex TaxID=47839 RepID=A0A024JSH8_9MYCO|nr:hypothetical protein BN973_01116 [Mycobacterium triplex]
MARRRAAHNWPVPTAFSAAHSAGNAGSAIAIVAVSGRPG